MHRRIDQRRADPTAPKRGLDEQPVELGFAAIGQDDGEADDLAFRVGDQDVAALDLPGGKIDGVRIGFKLLAIGFERQ